MTKDTYLTVVLKTTACKDRMEDPINTLIDWTQCSEEERREQASKIIQAINQIVGEIEALQNLAYALKNIRDDLL